MITIETVKQEVEDIQRKEKEISEFLEKNATRVLVYPEFNTRFCDQRLRLSQYYCGPVPSHDKCHGICSECEHFMKFIPSSYVDPFGKQPEFTPYQHYSAIGNLNAPFGHPIHIPAPQYSIQIPGWCLLNIKEGGDENVHLVEENGAGGESKEDNGTTDC